MVRRADIAGSAVVDYAWDCSAVAAIQELAWTLRAVVEGVRR
jgi:hypothetical protein